MVCTSMPLIREASHIIQTSSSSIPVTQKTKGPSLAPSPQDYPVPNLSLHLSYKELLKQNKEHKEREHTMSLELNGYKTRELA